LKNEHSRSSHGIGIVFDDHGPADMIEHVADQYAIFRKLIIAVVGYVDEPSRHERLNLG
jgi:hypothetical protein